MPNLPISGLTASASNAAATDVLPVVQTTGTGPVKMTVQQMAGGLLGSTTLSGATITADAPVLNMSQTWNNGAVTFTGLKFNVASDTSAAASLLMDLQVGTSSRFNVGKTGSLKLGVSPTGTNQAGTNVTIAGSQGTGTGVGGSIIFQVAPAGLSGPAQNALVDALTINSSSTIIQRGVGYNWHYKTTANQLLTFEANGVGVGGAVNVNGFVAVNYSFGTTISASADLILTRDASNTLAQRNANDGQTFRLYGRFTDITNDFERFFINAPTTSGAAVLLGTQKGATTGAARALELQTNGVTRLTIAAAGAITCAGSLQVSNAGLSLSAVGGNGFYTSGGGYLVFKSDGVLTLSDASDTSFNRLQFGGTGPAFPALKRVSANLQVIAADGTSSAGLIVGNQALSTTATDGFLYVPTCPGTPTGTPTTQTGTAPIVINTTNSKLYFYSDGQWRDAGP